MDDASPGVLEFNGVLHDRLTRYTRTPEGGELMVEQLILYFNTISHVPYSTNSTQYVICQVFQDPSVPDKLQGFCQGTCVPYYNSLTSSNTNAPLHISIFVLNSIDLDC